LGAGRRGFFVDDLAVSAKLATNGMTIPWPACCSENHGLDAVWLTPEAWASALAEHSAEAPVRVDLIQGLPLSSMSRPVLVLAADEREYYLKGAQCGRALVSEQVVARLGRAMGAPVPEVRILNLPRDLVHYDSNMRGIMPGLAHGSLKINDCSNESGRMHTHAPENRSRYVLLATLFGLTVAGDHQFLLGDAPPRLVYSVDHGLFLPERNAWRTHDLEHPDLPQAPHLDSWLAQQCSFTAQEHQVACEAVANLRAEDIATAVAAPPETWGILSEERVALAWYLGRRRDMLLRHLCSIATGATP